MKLSEFLRTRTRKIKIEFDYSMFHALFTINLELKPISGLEMPKLKK